MTNVGTSPLGFSPTQRLTFSRGARTGDGVLLHRIRHMAILHIFGDEYGTMPVSDSGEAFLAAMVFLPGALPVLSKWDGRRSWLVKEMQRIGASPQVACIRPTSGYAKALQAKFKKWIRWLGTDGWRMAPTRSTSISSVFAHETTYGYFACSKPSLDPSEHRRFKKTLRAFACIWIRKR